MCTPLDCTFNIYEYVLSVPYFTSLAVIIYCWYKYRVAKLIALHSTDLEIIFTCFSLSIPIEKYFIYTCRSWWDARALFLIWSKLFQCFQRGNMRTETTLTTVCSFNAHRAKNASKCEVPRSSHGRCETEENLRIAVGPGNTGIRSWILLLLHIRVVLGSNIGPETGYPDLTFFSTLYNPSYWPQIRDWKQNYCSARFDPKTSVSHVKPALQKSHVIFEQSEADFTVPCCRDGRASRLFCWELCNSNSSKTPWLVSPRPAIHPATGLLCRCASVPSVGRTDSRLVGLCRSCNK
jgi:hypothetical protein